MTLRGLMQLAGRDLVATPGRSLVLSAGIAVGVAVLALVVGLGLAARDLVLRQVVRELPVDTLEVLPKTLDLGLFKVNSGKLFGAQPLGPSTVTALRALPEVAAVYPKLEVNLPLGAQGGSRLFGRRLYTDLFMEGVPRELVEPGVREGFLDRPDVIPVLISDQLLELYNASVAPALDAPQLGAQTLNGFLFEIVVGRSLMLGNRGARTTGVETAQIAGVSRHAMRLGVTVPIETAQRLLAKYGESTEAPRYSGILVQARSLRDVPAVVAAVEGMGYAVDQTAQKTRHLLDAGTALAGGVGALVLVLAALNIGNSFMAMLGERRRELSVLRAVGATPGNLLLLVLCEALVVGLCGGLAGLAMAHGAAFLVDEAARQFLPKFPFKPESFFMLVLWLDAAVLGAALVAALLGALGPALRAAHRPLSQGLAD